MAADTLTTAAVIGALYLFYKGAGAAAGQGGYVSPSVGPLQHALAAADPSKYTTTLPSGESFYHPGAPSAGPYGGLYGLEQSRITGFYHL